MINENKNSAVLWTGGKDSCLALYEAHLSGHQIKNLITFVPANPNFLAHPLSFMKLQSEALQIPHFTIEIAEPYKENYQKAFAELKEKHSIDLLITGDIDEMAGHKNMVKECAEKTKLEIFMPLWKKDRKEIMSRFFRFDFQWTFSLVNEPHFTDKWPGKIFDIKTYNMLLAMENNIDICGENGEYHTLVLDSPLFAKKIQLEKFSKAGKHSMHYIIIEKASLKNKRSGA